MDFELVIVGMGPVGAVAANLAGRHGLRTLVLEKAIAVHDKPRALGFDHEVMRIFGNIGIADAIAPFVMPYRPSVYQTTGGQVIRRIDAAQAPHPLGWAPNYVFVQPEIEGALRRNLEKFSCVSVELGSEVNEVVNDEQGVLVTIRDGSGAVRQVRAGNVLACDGGTSPVRTRLGLSMEDLAFDEPWLVVDVKLREGAGASLPATNVQYCETQRPCTFVVGPGQYRRWEFMINPDEVPADVARPESVARLLSRWLAPDEYEIWRASTYRFHALLLRTWRAGGIFFLGDAAHMTPPFLAQGMCQGIRDAANLVWKLALVRRGLADPGLLDTYQGERAPHVRQTTLVAKEFGKSICERDPGRAASRDEELLAAMARQPGGTVRQSLIPGLSGGFLSAQASAARGSLFPQPAVRLGTGETGLLDDFTGAGFRIVASDDVDISVVAQCLGEHPWAQALSIRLVQLGPGARQDSGPWMRCEDVSGVLSGWMKAHGCGLVVARPDHYVYGTASTTAGALALMRELLAGLGHSMAVAAAA
ncbi:bifunctional 3-(3-hydroxy-phenyl)propionate/3-hydroxycinnamic acid hydroxylase [Cupriavidus necator]